MRWGSSALALAIVLFSTHVYADPLQKSEDIVKFFAGQGNLGASRGICVGTEEECKSKAEKSEAPPQKAGLDMMINFALDSAQLDQTARAELDEFAKALKDNRLSTFSFVVEGHTDATGTDRYNQDLSQRRAQSVAAFLEANGVESARLEAIGLGKSHPRVANPYDPVNRRVEMRIRTE
ncbi:MULTISPECIES: OmpA family protein [unclassified Mesorhizobium]|jgi:outer membrane protein OmpA-like peptidoglycan-associated protein|uniref:OmpA family protein n=1 Tax=unclassified Mesorhizobium TaxID=325217 RepID=UPI00241785B5|nr:MULTISPECIES: OmpA family protein [unclassified Mesorhizobium]MDG4892157.1 OmpA family protein [Mesorhizobium sp. WSM4976]